MARAMCWQPAPRVELEVLVDLRLLARHRRLVERELDPVVAVGDDLRHQRRVVGGDVVADELGHVHEAHDLVVELHPLVHPAQLDVADAVVDRLEQPLGGALAAGDRWRCGDVAGQVRAVVAAAVDAACAASRRTPRWRRPAPRRARPRCRAAPRGSWRRRSVRGRCTVDVGHLQGEVDDAVAVPAVVVGQRAVGADRAGEHEPGAAGAEDERL